MAFGLKLGKVSPRGFAARIAELVDGDDFLANLVAPMLTVRAQLIAGFNELHARLLAIVKQDAICRRLMGVPGVGAVTALARSEEHTSELQSLMRSSYAVFCLKKK